MGQFKQEMESGATNLYFIVPEQYSHEAERSILAICGDRLSLHGEVLSFSRLSSRVLAELGGIGARTLDNGGRLLLMSRAISAFSGQLHIYAKNEQTPDFLEKLVALSKEFKGAGVTPEALSEASRASGSPLKEKLSDLSLILSAYDAFFTRETANPDDRLDRLAERLSDSSIFEGGHVFFDGFTDFTAQELRVIEALLKKDVKMTVCLTLRRAGRPGRNLRAIAEDGAEASAPGGRQRRQLPDGSARKYGRRQGRSAQAYGKASLRLRRRAF